MLRPQGQGSRARAATPNTLYKPSRRQDSALGLPLPSQLWAATFRHLKLAAGVGGTTCEAGPIVWLGSLTRGLKFSPAEAP